MKRQMIIAVALSLPIASAMVGCANDSEFKSKVGPSSSAINVAEDAGARKVPSAAIYLRLAKTELDQSKDLVTAHNYEEATSLLLRAEADAELATALAQEDSEKSDASEAMSRVHQLRKQNTSEEGSQP